MADGSEWPSQQRPKAKKIKFIDEAVIHVKGGDGGAGAVSFRREKYAPRGGPDGGNGGRGGSVILRADSGLGTLMDLRYRKQYHAKNGRPGGPKDCTGASGEDLVIRVPVGTVAYDQERDTLVGDLVESGQEIELVRGGRGGRGNASFATASRRTPDRAQTGIPGEARVIQLELKLIADVGLVGFPNAGKSTLISRISGAKPRIADYPFTTLTPNLGVVRIDVDRSFVVADLPGLIEGAADGAGLGHQFLRHIDRTALFIFLITQSLEPGRSPFGDFKALRRELRKYDERLTERPFVVVLSQCDRPEVIEQLAELEAQFEGVAKVLPISSVTGMGLKALLSQVSETLSESGRWQ